MDISRVVLIGALGSIDRTAAGNQKDSAQRLFADVVFIDKTHQDLQPLLYQLNQESSVYQHSAKDLQLLQRDAFMMIGEVVNIDKQKKQIILTNNNIVSYNHLIIAGAAKGGTKECDFSLAFQSFIEALKVQKNLTALKDSPFCNVANDQKKCLSQAATVPSEFSTHVEQLILSKVLNTNIKPINFLLSGVELSLYEFQI